jgi:hypothetical protein
VGVVVAEYLDLADPLEPAQDGLAGAHRQAEDMPVSDALEHLKQPLAVPTQRSLVPGDLGTAV